MSAIYESTASFVAELDGQSVTVRRGDTIREGHQLLVNNPELFTPLVPKFEHTPPPEKKPEPKAAPEKPKYILPKPQPTKAAAAKPASAEAKVDDKVEGGKGV